MHLKVSTAVYVNFNNVATVTLPQQWSAHCFSNVSHTCSDSA